MTTLGLGIVFLALLMIYCGVKGKSLRSALLGHSVDSQSGSLLGGGVGSSTTAPSSGAAAGSSSPTAGQVARNSF